MVATGYFVPILVEIGRTFLTLFNSLIEFVFSSAAMLDFEKCNSWVSWFLDSVKMNPPAKFGANRTDVLFSSNSTFSKINVFVGGHLGFWKGSFLTFPLSGRYPVEAPYQIWRESNQRFGRYSDFCKFQNGGRRQWRSKVVLRPGATYISWRPPSPEGGGPGVSPPENFGNPRLPDVSFSVFLVRKMTSVHRFRGQKIFKYNAFMMNQLHIWWKKIFIPSQQSCLPIKGSMENI